MPEASMIVIPQIYTGHGKNTMARRYFGAAGLGAAGIGAAGIGAAGIGRRSVHLYCVKRFP